MTDDQKRVQQRLRAMKGLTDRGLVQNLQDRLLALDPSQAAGREWADQMMEWYAGVYGLQRHAPGGPPVLGRNGGRSAGGGPSGPGCQPRTRQSPRPAPLVAGDEVDM
jgi:hypothetical protein